MSRTDFMKLIVLKGEKEIIVKLCVVVTQKHKLFCIDNFANTKK